MITNKHVSRIQNNLRIMSYTSIAISTNSGNSNNRTGNLAPIITGVRTPFGRKSRNIATLWNQNKRSGRTRIIANLNRSNTFNNTLPLNVLSRNNNITTNARNKLSDNNMLSITLLARPIRNRLRAITMRSRH